MERCFIRLVYILRFGVCLQDDGVLLLIILYEEMKCSLETNCLHVIWGSYGMETTRGYYMLVVFKSSVVVALFSPNSPRTLL